MNFLLAFVLIFAMIYSHGKYIQNKEAVIGNVLPESKGSKVIFPKDKILKIDGIEIKEWNDIGKVLAEKDPKLPIQVELERAGKLENINLELTEDPETKRYIVGILPEYTIEKYGAGEAAKVSLLSFEKIFTDTLGGLKLIISGKVKSEEISGPIGIIKVVGDASKEGIGILVWLTALLSVNVGILNLMPLPALDGGRILFVILELIGIKVNKKFEERLHTAGMLILFAFIFYITANDIFNLTR